MTERYGQDVVDDIREEAGTLPTNHLQGRFYPNWIEQRWATLDTYMREPDEQRLDGVVAECVRELLMAVHVRVCNEQEPCLEAKLIEALPGYEEIEANAPQADVQLSLLGEA